MKFCISLGFFELKYLFYCLLILIISLYISYFIYTDKEILICEHLILESLCFFLGYLLNFIPFWISHIMSNDKKKSIINKLIKKNTQFIKYVYYKPKEEYLSIKDFIKIFFISIVVFFTEIIDIIQTKKDNNDDDNEIKKYIDNFIIFEYLIVFVITKYGEEVYYKHHYISFLILIFVEVIKAIYFIIKNLYQTFDIIIIALQIIYSILYGIFFLYIKILMKYNFISPPKCNFMIGIINVPLLIIIYFIISLTPLGNKDNEYYLDNIFELFKSENFDSKNVIHLLLLTFVYGLYLFIISKIIYEYTIYHIYIPILIEYFVENIIQNFEIAEKIFLISSFFIELIMILIFIEIIEINFCGLNENLKRNIQSRAMTESSLTIENGDVDSEIDDEDN